MAKLRSFEFGNAVLNKGWALLSCVGWPVRECPKAHVLFICILPPLLLVETTSAVQIKVGAGLELHFSTITLSGPG